MEALALIARLVEKHKYKPLKPAESEYVREQFRAALPDFLKDKTEGSDLKLYTKSGHMICYGFERIVIGDYGAYIEFSDEQAIPNHYIVMKGQEWRSEPKYSNSKYEALTHKCYPCDKIDNYNLLIYKQKLTVGYADYKVGMYYISVYDCLPSATPNGYAESEIARVQCVEHRKFYDSLWEIKNKTANGNDEITIVKRLDIEDANSLLYETEKILTIGDGNISSLSLPERAVYYD